MVDRIGKVLEWFRKNHAFVAWALAMLSFAWSMTLYLSGRADRPPPLPPPPPPIMQEQPRLDEFTTRSFGWVEDRDAADAVAAGLAIPDFKDTPAGQAALGVGESSYLWKNVEACWKASRYKNGQPYPNVDQKSVGCCCGAATKHTQDALVATQLMQHTGPGEWRPFAVEPAYAFSRVDIGRRQIRGDGSTGAWMAQAVSTLGNLAMDQYGDQDLRVFDPMKARSWGSSGVPASVRAECGKYVTRTVARIRSWEDCKKALDQGYPVLLTSNQGFEGSKDRQGHLVRDKDGFLRPGGAWPHAMALLGYRTGTREGGFILNSWGDAINTGPIGEGEPPTAGFYADASVVNRMCQSGDCWAFSSFVGFPARKLRIRVERARPLNYPFALREDLQCDRFSLAF